MHEFRQKAVIGASHDQVWAELAQYDQVAHWAPTYAQSFATRPGQGGVGAKRLLVHTSGKVVEEVAVEWNEGHSLAFELSCGLGFIQSLRQTWSIEGAPRRAVVAAQLAYTPKPGVLGTVVDRLFTRRALRRMLATNVEGLKEHVEARGAPGRAMVDRGEGTAGAVRQEFRPSRLCPN